MQGAQGDRLEHKPQICCVSHQQKQLRVRHLTIIVNTNGIKIIMMSYTRLKIKTKTHLGQDPELLRLCAGIPLPRRNSHSLPELVAAHGGARRKGIARQQAFV